MYTHRPPSPPACGGGLTATGTTSQEPKEGENERKSSQKEGLNHGERKASRRWNCEESPGWVCTQMPGLLRRAGQKTHSSGGADIQQCRLDGLQVSQTRSQDSGSWA